MLESRPASDAAKAAHAPAGPRRIRTNQHAAVSAAFVCMGSGLQDRARCAPASPLIREAALRPHAVFLPRARTTSSAKLRLVEQHASSEVLPNRWSVQLGKK